MNLSAALPTFIVTLREGFEAALVVGIVLACLEKANQSQLNRWVYQGIGGGIVASIMVGILLGELLQGVNYSANVYAPITQEVLQASFGLIAVMMLTWMLLWMTQQAKSMKKEVEGAIQTALKENQGAGKAIFLLVFIAVLREGFETVLFIIALFGEGWQVPTLGAITGLLTAALLGILLFKWGIKINLRLFFQSMGILLILIVAGLMMSVLKHLDAAVTWLSHFQENYAYLCLSQGPSCLLGPLVWDGTRLLPDDQFPGIILKSLFGYRETLYLAQFIAYVLFILIIGGLYLQNVSSQTIKANKKETSLTPP